MGPYPTSTRKFWHIVNKAKAAKKSNAIPNLKLKDNCYKSDEDKANIFSKLLDEIFKDENDTDSFDSVFKIDTENFVYSFDFSSYLSNKFRINLSSKFRKKFFIQ